MKWQEQSPCLYRIHEKPSPEKASSLITFLKDLGLTAKLNPENVNPADFRDILTYAEGKPYFGVVNKVMLRSMQKARYSETNAGHFGLTLKKLSVRKPFRATAFRVCGKGRALCF